MRPSLLSLLVMTAIFAVGLLALRWPELLHLSFLLTAILALLMLIDGWRGTRPLKLQAQRQFRNPAALAAWFDVQLRLQYHGKRALILKLYDHHPQHCQQRLLPLALTVPAASHVSSRYRLRSSQRGDFLFGQLQALVRSPWQLWHCNHWLAEAEPLVVYPNCSSVLKESELLLGQVGTRHGVRRLRQRGSGQDFHQLREFRQGDALRQVDWKASARMRKVISRDYQQERDQQLLLVLDSGRRMRAVDGELSHFDQALHSSLMLAKLALNQGDSVGLLTCGGSSRYLPSQRGSKAITQLLKTVYDLQPSWANADFEQTSERILAIQKRRALVVIISNVQEEDSAPLLKAVQRLSQRHLVLVASLKEQALNDSIEQPISDFNSALLNAATLRYMNELQQRQQSFRNSGVALISCTPAELGQSLLAEYLRIKAAGSL